jgi:transcriptional regulator with XRE-family HTH domain
MTSLDPQLVGQRIAALRLSKGWTQLMLAASANTSVVTISAYENGRTQLKRPRLLRGIAETLGVTPEELLIGPTAPTTADGAIARLQAEVDEANRTLIYLRSISDRASGFSDDLLV